jgi:hypothetical protein
VWLSNLGKWPGVIERRLSCIRQGKLQAGLTNPRPAVAAKVKTEPETTRRGVQATHRRPGDGGNALYTLLVAF